MSSWMRKLLEHRIGLEVEDKRIKDQKIKRMQGTYTNQKSN